MHKKYWDIFLNFRKYFKQILFENITTNTSSFGFITKIHLYYIFQKLDEGNIK